MNKVRPITLGRSLCSIGVLLAVVFIVWMPVIESHCLADEWVKGPAMNGPSWVDTSRYETRIRWVDTSYWETQWGWQWIPSGYWTYVSAGHEDFYFADMKSWPPWTGAPGYTVWWWQEAWYCCWDWGWYPMRFAYRWGEHSHGSKYLCPGYAWIGAWWTWHDKSYWAWIDTSHWFWAPYSVWVASGYWEQYQAWIPSGYWQEPLHGTASVSKDPPYVFTKWRWLTTDGLRQSTEDERAHLDLTIEWQTDRPVAEIREYADLQREDSNHTIDRLNITTNRLATPTDRGTLKTRVEYDYAGLARHYYVLTSSDGASVTLYCDIPINGYRAISIAQSPDLGPVQSFERSTQDTGTVSF